VAILIEEGSNTLEAGLDIFNNRQDWDCTSSINHQDWDYYIIDMSRIDITVLEGCSIAALMTEAVVCAGTRLSQQSNSISGSSKDKSEARLHEHTSKHQLILEVLTRRT
jgi:hypothetical protein